jgi:hypothetical protein
MEGTLRGIATTFAVTLLVVAAWLLGQPGAWGQGGIDPTVKDLRQAVREERKLERQALRNRCRPHRRAGGYRRAPRMIPAGELEQAVRYWIGRRQHARDLRSLCNDEEAVVRLVFPAATQGKAVAVGRCESHLWRYAVGDAGELGVFQIHPQHRHWIGERTWSRMFNPLVNAQVAYGMSRAGQDWSAWTCG